MRLEELVIENFRGIEACRVRFAESGVTIVEGPNEVGKSSIADALEYLIEHRSDSTRGDIQRAKPVHRDVGPEVTVTLVTGPYRFTYAKRWLRKNYTTLTVHSPVTEQLTGRDAHDRVKAILAETLDTALWKALHLGQGTVGQPGGLGDTSLGRALDLAAGADQSGDREDSLWDRIVAERDKYFTHSGQQPSHERRQLAQREADAQEILAKAEADLAQIESDTADIARLDREAVDLEANQAELERSHLDHHARLLELSERRQNLRDLGLERDRAQSDHDLWASVRDRRGELVADVAKRAQRLAEVESALAAAQPTQAAATRRREELVAQRARAMELLTTAEAERDVAVAQSDHCRRQIEVAQFTERRDRIGVQLARRDEAEAVLEGAMITPADIPALELAERAMIQAEAAAQAGSASLSATSVAPIVVVVDGDPVELAADIETELRVDASSRIEVPGLVTFNLRSGQQAEALAAQAQSAAAEWTRLCSRYGVADMSEARRLAQGFADAEATIADTGARIAADLRDLSLDDIERKIIRLQARIDEFVATHAVSAFADQHGETQAAVDRADTAVAEARTAVETCDSALIGANEEAHKLALSHSATQTVVDSDRRELASRREELAQARTKVTGEAIDEGFNESKRCLEDLKSRWAAQEAELDRLDPALVEAQAENATLARDRGLKDQRDNRERRQRLLSQLEIRGELGLAERRDTALSNLERLQVERRGIESRASAAALLHRTFEARRNEARSRYVAPFRERIEKFARPVFGETFAVEVDSDLVITSRTLDGVTVAYESLSGGAREQLDIISRLAAASIVSAVDGAPVVIDDALGWTDPSRVAPMAQVVALAARHCQVVVLTCTPGRFSAIGDATVVHLPQSPEPELEVTLNAAGSR